MKYPMCIQAEGVEIIVHRVETLLDKVGVQKTASRVKCEAIMVVCAGDLAPTVSLRVNMKRRHSFVIGEGHKRPVRPDAERKQVVIFPADKQKPAFGVHRHIVCRGGKGAGGVPKRDQRPVRLDAVAEHLRQVVARIWLMDRDRIQEASRRVRGKHHRLLRNPESRRIERLRSPVCSNPVLVQRTRLRSGV